MAGFSIDAVEEGVQDVLGIWRFEFLLNPPEIDIGISMKTLAIRCQQVAIPNLEIEPMIVGLHGMELVFRGRRTYSKTIAVSMVESGDGSTHRAIRKWAEFVVGTKSHNGAYKRQYACNGKLNVINQSGEPVHALSVYRVFPTNISEVQLQGDSSSPYIVQVTFSFDFYVDPTVQCDTGGLPATEY